MTQNNSSSQWKSLIGCLSRRVLMVCLALLVLPLMIHAFLITREAKKRTILDNLNNLYLISRSESSYLQLLLKQNTNDISIIEYLAKFSSKPANEFDPSDLTQIALTENLSSFYLIEKTDDQNFKVIAAAHPERANIDLKSENPIYEKILAKGIYYYLSIDPLSIKKEVRIGYSLGSNRLLISGYALDTISAQMNRVPLISPAPIIAFAEQDSDLFFSSYPSFDINQAHLLSPETLIDIYQQPFANFQLDKTAGFIGVKTPIADFSFYLIIAMDKKDFFASQTNVEFNHLFQLTLLFAIVGGGGVFLLASRIAHPLKQLFHCFDQLSKGDLTTRYENDPVGFELNILGQKFNQTVAQLDLSIKEAKEQRFAKELLKQELGIGRDIQKSILKTSIKQIDDLNLGFAFSPAMEVSGDFYDAFLIDENNLLVACADTSGKGISACLYSLGVRSMLRSLASIKTPINEMLHQVNQLFIEDAEYKGAFVTAFVGIIDLKNHTMQYATCGHPPIIAITGSGNEDLSTDCVSIGIDKTAIFTSKTFSFEKGDKVLIYTDGVIEAHNLASQMYGKERLDIFLKNNRDKDANLLVHGLQKDIDQFVNHCDQHDDITILCIERKLG